MYNVVVSLAVGGGGGGGFQITLKPWTCLDRDTVKSTNCTGRLAILGYRGHIFFNSTFVGLITVWLEYECLDPLNSLSEFG